VLTVLFFFLDRLRDEVKESESRNMELESKLIALTQTNGKLSKELASVSHNAGNFERELDAQKKRYEKGILKTLQISYNMDHIIQKKEAALL
jgi:hypothetical protein